MATIESATEIRPFIVDVPDTDLDDLRRRIAATRRPSKELVDDRSQGVQLATLQELARYWTTDYDWRKAEAKLNAFPQFTTEIDGVNIHFIHVKSPHQNALPLIMTHGWPGSVIELLEPIGPLTDPTAHGGRAEDAFDLVLPSLPGYGFSAEPTELGWDAGRAAQAWAELMHRLGYTRYVAQGGDVGAAVTDAMGRQAPEGLIGIHMNLLVTALAGAAIPAETEQERAAPTRSTRSGRAASATSWSRPRGRRRSATPCWIHPSPWRPGCSTTTRTATTRSPAPSSTGSPRAISPGPHPRQRHAVLADGHRRLGGPVVLGERTAQQPPRPGQAPPAVSLPVGFTTFPGEILRTPRSWVENGLPQRHLLQRGRQGRPLRRLGGAGALLDRGPSRVQVAARETEPSLRGERRT